MATPSNIVLPLQSPEFGQLPPAKSMVDHCPTQNPSVRRQIYSIFSSGIRDMLRAAAGGQKDIERIGVEVADELSSLE